MTSVPPIRDLASPMLETTTSMPVPGVANGGSFAVTMTAATFLVFRVFGSTRIPMRDSIATTDCTVNWLCCESPVWFRPTTMP